MVRDQVSSVRQRRVADTLQTRHAIASSSKKRYDAVELAELTMKARKRLQPGQFAISQKRAYPIPDESHARNALARVSQFGTPAEKAAVRATVARKFPNIGRAKMVAKKGGK